MATANQLKMQSNLIAAAEQREQARHNRAAEAENIRAHDLEHERHDDLLASKKFSNYASPFARVAGEAVKTVLAPGKGALTKIGSALGDKAAKAITKKTGSALGNAVKEAVKNAKVNK